MIFNVRAMVTINSHERERSQSSPAFKEFLWRENMEAQFKTLSNFNQPSKFRDKDSKLNSSEIEAAMKVTNKMQIYRFIYCS